MAKLKKDPAIKGSYVQSPTLGIIIPPQPLSINGRAYHLMAHSPITTSPDGANDPPETDIKQAVPSVQMQDVMGMVSPDQLAEMCDQCFTIEPQDDDCFDCVMLFDAATAKEILDRK